jgi:mono/diheme cytochrome c family protein
MKPVSHGPASRLALGVGLVAGAWLALSATSFGAQTVSPAGAPAAATGAVHVAQAAAAAPTDKPVSYTDEQADRGKKRFDGDCVDCHGEDLRGGLNGGPPLRGNAFEAKYAEGAPASALFNFMSTLMPPNDPGRYSASQYADLMSYVLKVNGFQSGSAELPSDTDALDHLIMEK